MEIKTLLEVEKLALKKQKVYDTNPVHYILRAALASMFIGFGVIVAFKTGGFFYVTQSPAAYPMAALAFGAAIILIAYGGGDLFTGNTFYFTYTALRKKMLWSTVFKLWTYSYIGNILGAMAFAFLIYTTGLFDDPSVNGFLLSVAEKKIHISTFQLFFRGILCNWLVCLAFFIPMALREEGAKLFVMILFVFCFFISGYEHSIANMCTFAIALVLEHPNTITFGGVIHNLVPVTIGNIIGGSFLMGWMYYYVNKPFLEEK
ncbi:formate/nitrite transporter family protein [Bacillus sp. 31A1R]|uniref:Formate/nitrite transporter family protein n=1 Tax=Robertmurraya mangrovi TaxID=3098077 RepID=A0ABU5IW67_9BACI|nr:formate/nitrite transporter family protein [Bacillus sp. 31A1R]MDZ5471395.1 formate/nitrite transporter family protein [Bacillus sp. 31A1R]